jgi:hypothetical protein
MQTQSSGAGRTGQTAAVMTQDQVALLGRRLLRLVAMENVAHLLLPPLSAPLLPVGVKGIEEEEGPSVPPIPSDILELQPPYRRQLLLATLLPQLLHGHQALGRGFVRPSRRMKYAVRVVDESLKVFRNLTLTSKDIRAELLSEPFYRAMYFAWYEMPVEGMDGRNHEALARATRHTSAQLEVPMLSAEDRVGDRLHSRWYTNFLMTVAYNWHQRWVALSLYRLQRFCTLGLKDLGGNSPFMLFVEPKLEGLELFNAGGYRMPADWRRRQTEAIMTDLAHLSCQELLMNKEYIHTLDEAVEDLANDTFVKPFMYTNGMLAPGTLLTLMGVGPVAVGVRPFLVEGAVDVDDVMIVPQSYRRYTAMGTSVRVLRVPTVLRPQAFALSRPPYDPLQLMDVTKSPIPLLLVWDTPVTVDLPLPPDRVAELTRMARPMIEPSLFDVGVIESDIRINLGKIHLASPRNTSSVLRRLIKTHPTYRFGQEGMRQSKIEITLWQDITLGPRNQGPRDIAFLAIQDHRKWLRRVVNEFRRTSFWPTVWPPVFRVEKEGEPLRELPRGIRSLRLDDPYRGIGWTLDTEKKLPARPEQLSKLMGKKGKEKL